MRRRVLLLLAMAAVCSPADTIHLKNGHTIQADRVRVGQARVEYDIGEDSYAIPKSLVERIESSPAQPDSASAGANAAAVSASPRVENSSLFKPREVLHTSQELAQRVVREGRVDSAALLAIERAGDSDLTAGAYFLAARHEAERGNRLQARSYLYRALNFSPNNPVILTHYAAVLVQMGSGAEAVPYAERATRLAPREADAFAVLGYADFASDRSQEAIAAWQRALELRPDPELQQQLAKAQREVAAEADFSQHESSHFTLRYEGQQTPDTLRRALLDALEADYSRLAGDFGAEPRSSITVVLYTDQAFFDVTQAPAWTSAVNDGKLRIPINGLTAVTPELARVLKHELAHSFINQMARGRCPQWLQEGIAQLEEPKSADAHGRRLAQLFAAQRQIPFNQLEAGFLHFSAAEAMLAYDESLAAAQYIRDTFGFGDLQRILERIGEGASPEAALQTTIHAGYDRLAADLAAYLNDKYGQ